MEFRVLGPLQVIRDGETLAPRAGKERAVLARLLLDPGRTVPADALLEAAWPGEDRVAATRSLSVRLASLRAFLEPSRERGAPSILVRDGSGYRLAIDAEQVDAQRFQQLVEQGDFEPALELWGLPFEDLADDPAALAEIQRLEALAVRARVGRARALVERGRHEEALDDLRALAAAEPLQEEVARVLALALYRSGRQVEALDALRALGRGLSELGLAADPETRALEQRILNHELRAPAKGTPVPHRASRFVGRDAERERAASLLADGRLVTIAGVGGAGKTRLALELAGDYAEERWWCELAPVGLDEDVPGALAEAVGIELAAGGAGLDHVVEHVARRRGLLVLDNCEHVLDGAAAAVERLLAAGGPLRVLATSRSPLGVDGERVLPLAGLDDAAARELFLTRSGGAVDAELPAVAEICRRVDGLPLAIELAAGRTRSLTATEIAARVGESFQLLSVAGRRGEARHDTLQAAIDWSYDLLDEPERRLFERLSVFQRGCTLAGAEAVCDADADLLDRLVAHSMVTATATEGVTRFGMLQSLREYAAARLERRGESGAVRDRHVEHFLRRVERVAEDFAGWRDPSLPLAQDFDDLRGAVRWCVAADERPERAFALLAPLWATAHSTRAHEIAVLAEEALARWPGGELRPAVLATAATARLVTGDPETAAEHADRALELDAGALIALRVRGLLQLTSGDLPEALAVLRDVSDRARRAGNLPLAIDVDGFLAEALEAIGRHSAAEELTTRLRAEADAVGLVFSRRWALYVSGAVALARDPVAASGWFDAGAATVPPVCLHNVARFLVRGRGVAAALEGRLDDAAVHLLDALAQEEAVGDAHQQAITLMAIALVLAEQGRGETAAELASAADRARTAAPLDVLDWVVTARAAARIAASLPADRRAAARVRGEALGLRAAREMARVALARAPELRH